MSPHSTSITFILTQTRNDSVKEASVTALHQVSRTKAAQRYDTKGAAGMGTCCSFTSETLVMLQGSPD